MKKFQKRKDFIRFPIHWLCMYWLYIFYLDEKTSKKNKTHNYYSFVSTKKTSKNIKRIIHNHLCRSKKTYVNCYPGQTSTAVYDHTWRNTTVSMWEYYGRLWSTHTISVLLRFYPYVIVSLRIQSRQYTTVIFPVYGRIRSFTEFATFDLGSRMAREQKNDILLDVFSIMQRLFHYRLCSIVTIDLTYNILLWKKYIKFLLYSLIIFLRKMDRWEEHIWQRCNRSNIVKLVKTGKNRPVP